MADKIFSHTELCKDLADSLDQSDRVVFVERPLGSKYLNNGAVPIPDVLVVNKSYTRPDIRIYEIKISESDLKSDIVSGKYLNYLQYCDRFFFAFPRNMLKDWKKLITDNRCGVILRGETGWTTARAPHTLQRKPWEEEIFFALLFGKYREEESRVERLKVEYDRLKGKELKDIHYSINKQLDKKLDDLKEMEHRAEHLKEEMKKDFFKELYSQLGMEYTRWHTPSVSDFIGELFAKPLQDTFSKSLIKLDKILKNEQDK